MNRFRLIAVTQYREWYGNDDFTEGRYKNKGVREYLLLGTDDPNFAFNFGASQITAECEKWNHILNRDGKFSKENLTDCYWESELTQSEQDQMEFYGEIKWPITKISEVQI